MNKDLNDYTKKEFIEMELFEPTKPFSNIIIVPMNKTHDSGFKCMKFILWNQIEKEIVGVVGGWCDVIHFNGYGGRGADFKENRVIDYSIDCLRKSNCLRIMTRYELYISDFIGSDFVFYVGKALGEK